MRANLKEIQLESSKHASSPTKANNINDGIIKVKMTENMGKVGDRVSHLS